MVPTDKFEFVYIWFANICGSLLLFDFLNCELAHSQFNFDVRTIFESI